MSADNPFAEATETFRAMTDAIRADRREREFMRALGQRNEAPSPTSTDPGDNLRAYMKEQRDAIARKLGAKR